MLFRNTSYGSSYTLIYILWLNHAITWSWLRCMRWFWLLISTTISTLFLFFFTLIFIRDNYHSGSFLLLEDPSYFSCNGRSSHNIRGSHSITIGFISNWTSRENLIFLLEFCPFLTILFLLWFIIAEIVSCFDVIIEIFVKDQKPKND